MRGVREYLGADEVFLTKKTFSNDTNRLARDWGILAIDHERIAELEKVWVPDTNLRIGSHDYEHFYNRHKQLYDAVIKNDPNLKEVFLFARSQFWYTDNTIRLKRTITHIDDLSLALVGDWAKGDVAYSQRWLLMELVILLRVKDLTGQGALFSLEEKEVPPPPYSEGLIDIVERLLARETSAAGVPRLLDLVAYEVVLKSGKVTPHILSTLFQGDLDLTLKLGKNTLFFLFDHTNLAREHVADLLGWELPS